MLRIAEQGVNGGHGGKAERRVKYCIITVTIISGRVAETINIYTLYTRSPASPETPVEETHAFRIKLNYCKAINE